VCVRNGRVSGGERCVHVGAGCEDVLLQGLCLGDFLFAGLVLQASRRVRLASLRVERAARAPFNSLFGVVALPSGGFAAADKLLRAAPVADASARGGAGLVLEDVSVQDVTPVDPCPGLRPASEPSVVDVDGYRINARACYFRLSGFSPTQDLRRRVAILGSIYEDVVEPFLLKVIEGAGAHAVLLVNWRRVEGLRQLRAAVPSRMPTLFAIDFPFLAAWGSRGGVSVVDTLDKELDPEDKTLLAREPLGVSVSRLTQDALPRGAYVPGRKGTLV
jgi:hypothetical protein